MVAITRRSILEEAIRTTESRGVDYDTPARNFERIARRWRVHLLNRFGVDVPLDGESVSTMMVDVKLARLEHSPRHIDSILDIAGYAACYGEIAGEESQKTKDKG